MGGWYKGLGAGIWVWGGQFAHGVQGVKSLPLEVWLLKIKEATLKKWQLEWDNIPLTNKLKNIKDTVRPWKTSNQNNRRKEVILTRLRIGHTNLTHNHLMTSPHDPPPICDVCRVPLSVVHILEHCTKYNQYRSILFKNNSIKEILSENEQFSAESIFRYLIFYKIINQI